MTKCPLCEVRRAALKEFDMFFQWLSQQPEWADLVTRYIQGKIIIKPISPKPEVRKDDED
jgi:hypothetical protein